MSEILSNVVDFAWGTPLLILLIGGGLYLVFVSRLKVVFGFFHAWKLILGKFHHKGDEKDEGQLTHFRALTNAISATVGMGNISGVAVAIHQGGPGAIFWMWVAALVGMNTKFFECTLSMMFRDKDHRGEVQGGPMFVIQKALPKAFLPLAYAFAFFGAMGTLALFNTNQVASYLDNVYSITPLTSGLIMAIVVGYIIFGGVVRIAEWTSKIVPFMCGIYIVGAVGIIAMNLQAVPGVFQLIFREAFSGRAAFGGVAGLTVMMIFRMGVKRAAFSNEAGIGTAPMAHGNAKTKEPIAEGLVAMVGPFIDTIIVCTLTATMILVSFPEYWDPQLGDGILMTQKAFAQGYGAWGTHLLAVVVFMFGFSTIIGTANYNEKCFNYILKGRGIFGTRWFYSLWFGASILWGALSSPTDMVNFLDICFAFMAVPNMIATVILAPKVKLAMDHYFEKYGIGKKAANIKRRLNSSSNA